MALSARLEYDATKMEIGSIKIVLCRLQVCVEALTAKSILIKFVQHVQFDPSHNMIHSSYIKLFFISLQSRPLPIISDQLVAYTLFIPFIHLGVKKILF